MSEKVNQVPTDANNIKENKTWQNGHQQQPSTTAKQNGKK